jgi:carbon-monoxide dehydrogenase small subunit
VAGSPDAVWAVLQDIPRVARCLPGAEIESIDGAAVRGRMVVKFGPIKASFAGTGAVSMDAAARAGVLTGQGRDAGSGSQTQGELNYRVRPGESGGSAIDIDVRYRLTGPLAQFSRGALVRDLVAHLADRFAQNLSALVAGGDHAPEADAAGLTAFGLVWGIVKRRLQAMFGKH